MNNDTITSGPSAHWDQSYYLSKQLENRNQPSDFVLSIAKQLDANDTVLELGCGVGVDAAYLAKRVRAVMAVDFATKQIEANRERFTSPNLTFEALDLTQGLGEIKDSSFSAVYARRSLHYFDDDTTRFVFREISQVLQSNGQLFFECKSVKDPLAGQVAKQGDVRHFFGADELPELLPDFEIEHVAEKPAPDFYGFDSIFFRCWARKK